jgi:SAM-dependent methyltransferase
MIGAFQAWEAERETLEEVERRIHDNVPIEKLRERARDYLDIMFYLFPWLKVSPTATAVEVGPGVGYIMQAFLERRKVAQLIGLDVASSMIRQAHQRIARDGISPSALEFRHYDGVTFPFTDGSIDFFYSVAAIQHVPKPFAYNMFQEITRCLKPTGFAVVQLLGWDHLPSHPVPWKIEINQQIGNQVGHWHHYYERKELEIILEHGMSVPYYQIRQRGTFIWAAWCNSLDAFGQT